MDDLERMKAEFAAKGGKVEVLPATEYEEIISGELRLRNWGFSSTIEEQKIKDSLRDQRIAEEGKAEDDQ
jgi:hypothetical protein